MKSHCSETQTSNNYYMYMLSLIMLPFVEYHQTYGNNILTQEVVC